MEYDDRQYYGPPPLRHLRKSIRDSERRLAKIEAEEEELLKDMPPDKRAELERSAKQEHFLQCVIVWGILFGLPFCILWRWCET